MHASCHLWGFFPDCWDGPFLKLEKIPEVAKVCSPEVLACQYHYLLYSPPFRLPNTTSLWSLQPGLSPAFTPPTSSSLFVRIGSSRSSRCITSSLLSGSCHQHTPETSWIAHAWLSCPSSRYGSGLSPL